MWCTNDDIFFFGIFFFVCRLSNHTDVRILCMGFGKMMIRIRLENVTSHRRFTRCKIRHCNLFVGAAVIMVLIRYQFLQKKHEKQILNQIKN